MTHPQRHVGAYGRRPPKNAPALLAADFLTGAVPAAPPSADYLAALGGGWRMLGNGPGPDNAAAGVPPGGAGDCVSVMLANQRRLVTSTLALPGQAAPVPYYATLPQVVGFYRTQNPRFPAQDDGMDIQTALETCVNAGGPDGTKALGFAKVNPGYVQEVKAAIATGGSLCVGINVQAPNEDEFAAGEPWDYHPRASDVGGHGVVAGGYGPEPGARALGGDEKFITWAAETSFTDSFWGQQVEECWLVIWPEHLGSREFLAGLDVAAFAAAYEQITGRPFPAPVPVTPPPAGDPDGALWAVAGPWAAQTRVRPDLAELKGALNTWAAAVGLTTGDGG